MALDFETFDIMFTTLLIKMYKWVFLHFKFDFHPSALAFSKTEFQFPVSLNYQSILRYYGLFDIYLLILPFLCHTHTHAHTLTHII